MYSKAVESIQKFGMVDPVLVREVSKEIPYQVIDGEHRANACIDLGVLIPAHSIGKITDAEAKKLTIALNEVHGTASPVEMGKLLDELLTDSSMDELLSGLPMTAETVKAFQGAAGIEWPADKPEPVASPSATEKERWVERTYRLPASVAEVLDQALSKARDAFADGQDHSDAECLEVVAAEYMAS